MDGVQVGVVVKEEEEDHVAQTKGNTISEGSQRYLI
jgi:hypothetical protein